jgi:RND family efflux transporter MFP subunit
MILHRSRIMSPGRRGDAVVALRWAVIMALPSLAGCGQPDDAAKPGEAPPPAVAASIDTVEASPFSDMVDGVGVVSARVGHIASLSAPAPTRVTAVRVRIGDRVKRGDILVSLESIAFDADAASAEAALATAEQAAARARRLVDAGVAPRKELELATAELAAARAAAVNARRAQQLAQLRSPIDGVVTRLSAVLGASVDAGQQLIEVADPQTLDMQLMLSPAAAAGVRPGQRVVLRDGPSGEAAAVGTGRVADISAVVDSSTRAVSVRVTIAEHTRPLRIGESLFGEIVTATHPDAIVIPDNALVPTGEGFQVFVVDSAGQARARAVTIGGRSGHAVWITEGVKAGDAIVTTGAYGMDDGAHVVTATRAKP